MLGHHGCSLCLWMELREVKTRVDNVGVELCTDNAKWKLNAMFAHNIVLIVENKRDLQKFVEFNTVC